ncbi:hypothetical protein ZIOFF_043438 [Zingiber officinale]|uniref:Uncharacterized protein n=1 Tax=Zingiber officinale TaxID=94328 RepID=A0A8J5KWB9_ZINOF|nr:hypothetical protein ZIOFF_043438 [Zingiber officinale]
MWCLPLSGLTAAGAVCWVEPNLTHSEDFEGGNTRNNKLNQVATMNRSPQFLGFLEEKSLGRKRRRSDEEVLISWRFSTMNWILELYLLISPSID